MENESLNVKIPSEKEARKYAESKFPDDPEAQELQIKAHYVLRMMTKRKHCIKKIRKIKKKKWI